MVRLLVTASATGPIRDSVTSQAAASASPIMVGPDTVPPGRSWPVSWGTRIRSAPANAAPRNPLSSSASITMGRSTGAVTPRSCRRGEVGGAEHAGELPPAPFAHPVEALGERPHHRGERPGVDLDDVG